MAERYRVWTTRNGKGRKVAALAVSVEYEKTAAVGVTIESIADIVKENWSVYNTLGSGPNLFLLVADWLTTLSKERRNAAIRQKHPTTPIFMFCGHTHKRDCRMDFYPVGHARSIALKPLKPVRRYLDPTRETFMRHSGVDKASFDTEGGKEVMRNFDELAGRMGLDEFYGKNAKDDVLKFYMKQVFLDVVNVRDNATGEKRPYFVLLNNGFMRGPIHKGELTKNDKYINTPYKQRFSYIRLPHLIVERVLEMLDNLQGAEDVVTDCSTAYASAGRRPTSRSSIRKTLRCKQQLGPADDIIHTPPGLRFQIPPTYVHFRSPSTQTLDKYDLVDVVVIQRLENRVRTVANAVIAMHNAFCEEKWRLCKPISTVERGAWKGYGVVDSSDAVREYAKTYRE
ncbi:hypothetical protein FRB90_000093 [Tulasnella sp. 427]|nr:hypothetical protein FRB90_000093 [Tulasnella sp. 427]